MNKQEVFYRVTYDELGIYEALKNVITIEEWKKLLSSDKFNWLPKPNLYNDNNKSFFTKKDMKNLMKKHYLLFVTICPWIK